MREFPERPIVGVGAVVLNADRDVLLVKRGHAPLKGEWSLPGGGVEVGETLEAALVRELFEETGASIVVGPVVEVLDRIERAPDGRVAYHFVIIDYLCHAGDEPLVCGSDAEDVQWVGVDRLREYQVRENAVAVILKGVEMNRSWSPASRTP
jgi:8-oxo-dGTP diphosphatase